MSLMWFNFNTKWSSQEKKKKVTPFFSFLSKGWNAQFLLQKMQVLIYPVVFPLDMEKHYSIHFLTW